MAQYIDKSAVVAEIEKVIDEPAPSHDQQCPWEDGYYSGLYKAESILDTLEVKEVEEESVSKDLEEASNNYAESEEKRVGCGTEFFTPELAEAFKAGSQWMKQQMMKDAIDAVIHPYDGEIWTDKKHLEKYDEFQKVKVIIIKEE